mmetsp:Transcript_10084/g.29816  ORF Transcript_10084/g.29816 Transcript_10084/m.29816 type:complete len:315 (-) Transcript_10084:1450-2394(-)
MKGFLLLLHDPDVFRVYHEVVRVHLEVELDHTLRRQELILVRSPFGCRQPVQHLPGVLPDLLGLHQNAASLRHRQLQHDDVDDTLQLAVHFRDGRLALDELVREFLQGLRVAFAELCDVDAVLHQQVNESLLIVAHRGLHQGRDFRALFRGPELDLLGLALRLTHPVVYPHALLRVLRAHRPSRLQTNSVQHSLVGRDDLALDDLLPVDRADTRVGRRVVLLLEDLRIGEVQADLAVGHVEPLGQEPLRNLQRVLVRVLLCAWQLVNLFPYASVAEVLRLLNHELGETARAMDNTEQHDIHHAHDSLVLLRVQH